MNQTGIKRRTMRSAPKFDPFKNQFLARLPDEELKNLRPHIHLVSGKLSDVLFGAGDSVQYLFFPLGAVISIVTNTKEGRGVEVALIGSEGLVGVWAAMGSQANWHDAVVQAPGALLRIKVSVFRAELNRSPALRDHLNRYMLFLLAQVSQTAACNRLHRLEQRLARWLLMTHDQVRTKEFHQTHEFLSHMLGTDRSEVTIAAGILRKAGLISYLRGKVKIVDRTGLEEASCECYRIIANESIRLREKRK
jgi:CRP-like cAMP-binding protein